MRPHRIKSNKGIERPSKVIFFDVETTQRPLKSGDIAQDFRYGEALYWRRAEADRKETLERFQIWDIPSFWSWVKLKLSGKSRTIFVSHNLNIDMVALETFEHLPEMGYELISFYVVGMTKIIKFKGHGRSVLFLDNANWWKSKLADLGKLVGYEKMDVNPLKATLDELIPYCKRDVEILYRLWARWIDFLDEHDLGCWGVTIGSQAFKTFTHRFMAHDLFPTPHKGAIKLERESYRGGRTEAFWVGSWSGEDMFKVDVNSMYPYVMKEESYPTKLVAWERKVSVPWLRRIVRSRLVTAEVWVDVDEPVFPQVGKHGVYYPVGSFRAVLTTPEVLLALERGWIERVGRVAIYDKAPIFQEYIDYFYDLKGLYGREGNQVYYQAVKYMLNTLYGKFGQKGLTQKILAKCDPSLVKVENFINAQTGEKGVWIYLGGQVIEMKEGETSYNSFVAIAAHVTAHARTYLWRMINEAGRGDCVYCDTDSLILSDTGLGRLSHMLDDERIGLLKLEAVASEGVIHGKKDYEMGEKVVLKGVPASAILRSDGSFSFDMWPSLRLLLRQGDVSQYFIRPSTRTLKRQINWGRRLPSGWIAPFRLGEPEIRDETLERRLVEIDIEIETLQEARQFDQKLVFTVWDYVEGQVRRSIESGLTFPQYKGISLDVIAQEQGYDDMQKFYADIEQQVNLQKHLKRLRLEYAELSA